VRPNSGYAKARPAIHARIGDKSPGLSTQLRRKGDSEFSAVSVANGRHTLYRLNCRSTPKPHSWGIDACSGAVPTQMNPLQQEGWQRSADVSMLFVRVLFPQNLLDLIHTVD